MRRLPLFAVSAVLLLASSSSAQAPAEATVEPQEPKIDWIEGPKQVDLGEQIARIELSEEHLFAGAKDAQKLLEAMGNTVDGSELGMVASKTEGQNWLLIFEWSPVGYVKDDDKDKIDPDALLKSLREGTEQANERRKQMGIPAVHVTGWQQPPHYDSTTHNLVWSVLAKNDNGRESVNYNVRLLGREGYMSVTLVDAPQRLELSKPEFEKVLKSFAFQSGKTYAEWKEGDKVAEYGLTALVAAGAGAAAVKLGLFAALGKFLAKGWKLVVVAVVGLGAGLKRLFGSGRSGPMSGQG